MLALVRLELLLLVLLRVPLLLPTCQGAGAREHPERWRGASCAGP